MKSRKIPQYKTKIFTGIRPTGGLTIANALGAVIPLIHLQQETGGKPLVFVADLHALTDHEPNKIKESTIDVVADYLALGLDPNKVDIFIQSDIKAEVLELTALLSRHITIAELIRIPTLKEKVKGGKNPEQANTLLAFYPIIMAADILLQRAEFVPVGEDQQPHIEMTRSLAKKFNKDYGNVFPLPKPQTMKQLRIMDLAGRGKMSKSVPQNAIFLSDSEDEIRAKIKRAQTAFEGEMPDVLVSHFIVARTLTEDKEVQEKLDSIEERHINGEKVMGEFKEILAEILVQYINSYQTSKKEILEEKTLIADILGKGEDLSRKNAEETMSLVREAMGL